MSTKGDSRWRNCLCRNGAGGMNDDRVLLIEDDKETADEIRPSCPVVVLRLTGRKRHEELIRRVQVEQEP